MIDSNSARSALGDLWMRAWIVPPLVLPIAFGVMIAAYVLYSAFV
jgi:hypothetical protein